ncbi:MAG: TIGR02147 family protein [Fibrobacteria bacterium]
MGTNERERMGEKPDIINYTNYRLYLADVHAMRKLADPRFSVRAFAKEAGFSSHTLMRYVLDGKRNLSKKTLLKLSLALKLTRERAEYFENLVFFNQSKTLDEKNTYYQRLLKSKQPNGLKKLEESQFRIFNTWYHSAIREMLALSSFRNSPEWIAGQLQPRIEPREAQESLKLLLESGLIKRTPNGYKTVDDAITTDDEVLPLFVRNYHLQMIEMAKKAIDSVDPEKRDISAVSFPIREADFPKLKKQIQLMRKELRHFAAEGGEGERVVQVNIQLFPLNKGTGA